MEVDGSLEPKDLEKYEGVKGLVQATCGKTHEDELNGVIRDVLGRLEREYGTKIQVCVPWGSLEDGGVSMYLVFDKAVTAAEANLIIEYAAEMVRSHR